MFKILFAAGLLLGLAACDHSHAAPPTVDELMNNPSLLHTWKAKCAGHDLDSWSADDRTQACSRVDTASLQTIRAAAAKATSDFVKHNVPDAN